MERGFVPQDLKLHIGSEWIKRSKNWRDNPAPLKWYFTQNLSFDNETLTPCVLCILTNKQKKKTHKKRTIQLTYADIEDLDLAAGVI